MPAVPALTTDEKELLEKLRAVQRFSGDDTGSLDGVSYLCWDFEQEYGQRDAYCTNAPTDLIEWDSDFPVCACDSTADQCAELKQK